MPRIEILHDNVGSWTKGQVVEPTPDQMPRRELRRLLDLGAVRMAGPEPASLKAAEGLDEDLLRANDEIADRFDRVARDLDAAASHTEALQRRVEELTRENKRLQDELDRQQSQASREHEQQLRQQDQGDGGQVTTGKVPVPTHLPPNAPELTTGAGPRTEGAAEPEPQAQPQPATQTQPADHTTKAEAQRHAQPPQQARALPAEPEKEPGAKVPPPKGEKDQATKKK